VLTDRSVLAVTTWVAETGLGGILLRDLVLVTEDGPDVLTADVPDGLGDEG
jgi:Xaa-Pro aminopeptidase